MTDTLRSQDTLLTALFQDGQANASITAQDIRDAIVSLSPAYGGFDITTAIATTIAAASTYVKALGTTTISTSSRGVTMPASNRLTYTQAPTRVFQVIVTLTATSAANAQTLGFQLAKNGSLITNTEVTKSFTLLTDNETISLSTLISLATNDYLELFVSNNTAINDLTITNMSMSIMGVI